VEESRNTNSPRFRNRWDGSRWVPRCASMLQNCARSLTEDQQRARVSNSSCCVEWVAVRSGVQRFSRCRWDRAWFPQLFVLAIRKPILRRFARMARKTSTRWKTLFRHREQNRAARWRRCRTTSTCDSRASRRKTFIAITDAGRACSNSRAKKNFAASLKIQPTSAAIFRAVVLWACACPR